MRTHLVTVLVTAALVFGVNAITHSQLASGPLAGSQTARMEDGSPLGVVAADASLETTLLRTWGGGYTLGGPGIVVDDDPAGTASFAQGGLSTSQLTVHNSGTTTIQIGVSVNTTTVGPGETRTISAQGLPSYTGLGDGDGIRFAFVIRQP